MPRMFSRFGTHNICCFPLEHCSSKKKMGERSKCTQSGSSKGQMSGIKSWLKERCTMIRSDRSKSIFSAIQSPWKCCGAANWTSLPWSRTDSTLKIARRASKSPNPARGSKFWSEHRELKCRLSPLSTYVVLSKKCRCLLPRFWRGKKGRKSGDDKNGSSA